MKFRRTVSAICSSALVFGLTLLLTPQTQSASTPTVTPSNKLTPTLSASAPTDIPSVTAEPTVGPTPTPAFVHPLYTDELNTPSAGVTDLVTAYINSYYENDFETASALVTNPSLLNASVMESDAAGVTGIEGLTLYAKPGINGIFSVVYADYSLTYDDSSLSIPQFSEYYIERNDDGSYLIHNDPLPDDTHEAMLQARETETVLNLSVSALIQRYNNACLLVDETLLKQCVTDTDYLNMDYFSSRFAYTEYFSDYEFILYPGINEFDYIVYITYNEKIVLIDTPAPCVESYCISIDKTTGEPLIFLGITSLDTDAYCASVDQSDEIQALAAKIDQAMTDALLADDDLNAFYNRLTSGQE